MNLLQKRQEVCPPTFSMLAGSIRIALLTMAVAAPAAWAQSTGDTTTATADANAPRVEITGSAIRRIVSETPLPVQVCPAPTSEKPVSPRPPN